MTNLKHTANGHLAHGANGHMANDCDCCAGVGNCNCGVSDTDPRVKLTISWSENEWQSSTLYYVGVIVKYTPDPSGDPDTYYLFCKQNTGSHTSGGTPPSWDTTIGNTTTDNTITWVRIPNDFNRKYYSCTWSNGETKELCPTTSYLLQHVTNAVQKLNVEQWRKLNTAGAGISFYNKFYQALMSFRHPRRHIFKMARAHFSQKTSYGLPGFTGAVKATRYIRMNGHYKEGAIIGSSSTYVPPSSSVVTTNDDSAYLVSASPNVAAVNAYLYAKPLGITQTSVGVPNIQFGTETDVCGVTFDWARLSPAQATIGTPTYWQATAP